MIGFLVVAACSTWMVPLSIALKRRPVSKVHRVLTPYSCPLCRLPLEPGEDHRHTIVMSQCGRLGPTWHC